MIEWESHTDTGELDAAWFQPNFVLQRVADYAEEASFAVPLTVQAGVRLPWDAQWLAVECAPLPELLDCTPGSRHAQACVDAVKWITEHPTVSLPDSFVWAVDVEEVKFTAERPPANYPCCEEAPVLRVWVTLQGEDAAEAAARIASMRHAAGDSFGGRRRFNARCQCCWDGRKWRRLDLKDSIEDGLGGRTIFSYRCDALLQHLGRDEAGDESVGEGVGGDSAEMWDARLSTMRRVSYFDESMLFGSGAEASCQGLRVRFEPNLQMRLDLDFEMRFIDGAGQLLPWLPEHVNVNTVVSPGCGRYAPNTMLDVTFRSTHPRLPHAGSAATAQLRVDATGWGVEIVGFDGGSGYYPNSVSAAIQELPTSGGPECTIQAITHERAPGALSSTTVSVRHLRIVSSRLARIAISNITARQSFATNQLLPCDTYPDASCVFNVRWLRQPSERHYSMDYWQQQLNYAAATRCFGWSCTEYAATETDVITATGDLVMVTSASARAPLPIKPCQNG